MHIHWRNWVFILFGGGGGWGGADLRLGGLEDGTAMIVIKSYGGWGATTPPPSTPHMT